MSPMQDRTVDIHAGPKSLQKQGKTLNIYLAATTCLPGPLYNIFRLELRAEDQLALRQVKTIELHMTAHVAISIMTVDHLTLWLKDCFKDSVTAATLSMGGTKCTVLDKTNPNAEAPAGEYWQRLETVSEEITRASGER